MATFPSLTEKDLCEIGITAWGARRKIMLLISGMWTEPFSFRSWVFEYLELFFFLFLSLSLSEMNKRTSPFSGSAAPGAERKSSLPSASSSSSLGCNLDTKW